MFGVKTMSLTPNGPFAKLSDGLGSLEHRSAFVASQKSGNRAMICWVLIRTPDARYSQPTMVSSRHKKASEPEL